MITGQEVVNYAQFIGAGRPYILGAAGPAAYDCSGLILAVFQHYNIASFPALPREAGAQARWLGVNGVQIPVAEATSTPGAVLAIDIGYSGAGAGGNHIGFCLSPGISFEARSRAYGIGSWPLSVHKWTGGYLIPGVSYPQPVPQPDPVTHEKEEMLPYYMLKSAKYQNIFACFGGPEGRVVEALLGPGEYAAFVSVGVPFNANVNDDEIRRAHAESGGDTGTGGPLLPIV